MGNEETVAIDRTGVVVGVAGVERIGLAVEPFPLRLVRIDLTFQRHIVGHSPFEAGPKPKLPGASEVVEHIVVGFRVRESMVTGPRSCGSNDAVVVLPETTPFVAFGPA